MVFVSSYTMQRFLDGVADDYDRRVIKREIQREADRKREKEEAQEADIKKIYDFLCAHSGIAYSCTDILHQIPDFGNTQKISGPMYHIRWRTRAKNPIVEGATIPVNIYQYKKRYFYCTGDFQDFADPKYSAEYHKTIPTKKY